MLFRCYLLLQYYHYRQWMRRRLRHACPGLPAAVEEKLLATDADDLDLLLQHPLGVQAQV